MAEARKRGRSEREIPTIAQGKQHRPGTPASVQHDDAVCSRADSQDVAKWAPSGEKRADVMPLLCPAPDATGAYAKDAASAASADGADEDTPAMVG
jgi:hypothetical protein